MEAMFFTVSAQAKAASCLGEHRICCPSGPAGMGSTADCPEESWEKAKHVLHRNSASQQESPTVVWLAEKGVLLIQCLPVPTRTPAITPAEDTVTHLNQASPWRCLLDPGLPDGWRLCAWLREACVFHCFL